MRRGPGARPTPDCGHPGRHKGRRCRHAVRAAVTGAPVLCGNVPTRNATVFLIEQVLRRRSPNGT
ncbi:MAG: hypothetical protein JOZ09_14090 [Pseudonocardiales bacterium]|nr:hypothetical protein [Pseudonocardiales bacterium]